MYESRFTTPEEGIEIAEFRLLKEKICSYLKRVGHQLFASQEVRRAYIKISIIYHINNSTVIATFAESTPDNKPPSGRLAIRIFSSTTIEDQLKKEITSLDNRIK
ncbi:MAG: hypothetical protein HYS32_00265 [Candidatus Woesearchaeota archaeon]|nr:MAG: hypothetical protein HYS32_00265 [Candidatus Woesearchaeota archaeon]